MIEPGSVVTVVLAAGLSTRFGGPKVLAPLRGRPLLAWVLDTMSELRFGQTIVVLGYDADAIERSIVWHGERRIRNPQPEDGQSTSLRLGLAAAAETDAAAALIALGDQPLLGPDTVRRLLARFNRTTPIVVPAYDEGGGPNPVLIARSAWTLAADASGDRGLGPILRARPGLVTTVAVGGENPDVDTPADLAALERSLG